MSDLKNFITRNSAVFFTAYIVVTLFIIGLLSHKLIAHKCEPYKNEVILQNEYREKINEINNAEDRDTIDSLLLELYGFSSK